MNKAASDLCLIDFKPEDNTHMFCECVTVIDIWEWIKSSIQDMVNIPTENFDLLNFSFPKTAFDKEILWMVSTYCEYLWTENIRKGRKLKLSQVKFELKYKWLENNSQNSPTLNFIDFI